MSSLSITRDRRSLGRSGIDVFPLSYGCWRIAGTTVAFPFMLVVMAFGMLIGFGGTALISIRLGEGRRTEAEQVLAREGGTTHYVRTQLEAERGLLRLREGRLDEAEAHFRQGGTSPYVALGLATIAFERGDAATARARRRYDRYVGNQRRSVVEPRSTMSVSDVDQTTRAPDSIHA